MRTQIGKGEVSTNKKAPVTATGMTVVCNNLKSDLLINIYYLGGNYINFPFDLRSLPD